MIFCINGAYCGFGATVEEALVDLNELLERCNESMITHMDCAFYTSIHITVELIRKT